MARYSPLSSDLPIMGSGKHKDTGNGRVVNMGKPHPLTTKRGWEVGRSFLIKHKRFGVAGSYGLGLRAGQVQLISYAPPGQLRPDARNMVSANDC